MKKRHVIKLPTYGGGRLTVHGSLSARRLLVILSRENFQQDDQLVRDLIGFLLTKHLTVVHYESALAVTARKIDFLWLNHLPRAFRISFKALTLLCLPAHWHYFSTRHRAEGNTLSFRTRAVAELVQFLGSDKELIFLTRSASSRIASSIADEVGIHKLICVGYPFKHPDREPEPERYLHLARLKTPCLILQGIHDPYGGGNNLSQYPLAEHIRLEHIDADHGFSVTGAEWQRILKLISEFID